MLPNISLGNSSIMAAVTRGKTQAKAHTKLLQNHVPGEITKDAEMNASTGADIVTLTNMLRFPPSNIITRIKLLEG
eukprot:9797811-Heterocapsa_arctica.AAC.1